LKKLIFAVGNPHVNDNECIFIFVDLFKSYLGMILSDQLPSSQIIINDVEIYFPSLILLDLIIYAENIKEEYKYKEFKLWLYQNNDKLLTLIDSKQ